ncbi:MAG: hypothetical protein OFPII_33800 [Osedax symbiont Rs1]|nr:MAG: hypothetical protein OFPII_33800 [Osedax symbiont Rs1]
MQQLSEMYTWIESLIVSGAIKIAGDWDVCPLKGDASCRSYFRLHSAAGDKILVSSPVQRIDNSIFIARAEQWRQYQVNVPSIYCVDEQRGFMLIEDFGNRHLFDLLTSEFNAELYQKAIEQLIEIQKVPHSPLVAFDREFLLREMRLFEQWLVKYQLDLAVPSCLDAVYELLVESALEQPQVTMHRDFHSRNLLVKQHKIAVIDFQDAVRGPISYDLASLLRDCYINITDQQTAQLINYYLQLSQSAQLLNRSITPQQFEKWFDLIGLQRHLKVLGLFIRLGVEEQKSAYLADIPRVFGYVLKIAAKYSELAEFSQWLEAVVAPALTGQRWYSLDKTQIEKLL